MITIAYMGLEARKHVFGVCKQQRLSYLLVCSIISKLAASEISFFYLVSVAEETGSSLALSETPKQVFMCRGPYVTDACTMVWINKKNQRKIVNVFLPKIFSICFGCSKEPSHMSTLLSIHNICFG